MSNIYQILHSEDPQAKLEPLSKPGPCSLSSKTSYWMPPNLLNPSKTVLTVKPFAARDSVVNSQMNNEINRRKTANTYHPSELIYSGSNSGTVRSRRLSSTSNSAAILLNETTRAHSATTWITSDLSKKSACLSKITMPQSDLHLYSNLKSYSSSEISWNIREHLNSKRELNLSISAFDAASVQSYSSSRSYLKSGVTPKSGFDVPVKVVQNISAPGWTSQNGKANSVEDMNRKDSGIMNKMLAVHLRSPTNTDVFQDSHDIRHSLGQENMKSVTSNDNYDGYLSSEKTLLSALSSAPANNPVRIPSINDYFRPSLSPESPQPVERTMTPLNKKVSYNTFCFKIVESCNT